MHIYFYSKLIDIHTNGQTHKQLYFGQCSQKYSTSHCLVIFVPDTSSDKTTNDIECNNASQNTIQLITINKYLVCILFFLGFQFSVVYCQLDAFIKCSMLWSEQ